MLIGKVAWGFSRQSRTISSPLTRQYAKVAIVGGGLAGLSTAYHLLSKEPTVDITIWDETSVGAGGASAVAGG